MVHDGDLVHPDLGGGAAHLLLAHVGQVEVRWALGIPRLSPGEEEQSHGAPRVVGQGERARGGEALVVRMREDGRQAADRLTL